MTKHNIEYIDANTSYCHTCDQQLPNAHVYHHEGMAELEERMAEVDEPNQTGAPLPDEDVIRLETIGEMLVEDWLGGGRNCAVLSTGLSGGGSGGPYTVGVSFEGYLTGPFNHRTGANYRAYLGQICEDNRVLVEVYYEPDHENI